MPIFSYFLVVGATLLGLLIWTADRIEPQPPSFPSSQTVGLPQPYKAPVPPEPVAAAEVPAVTKDRSAKTLVAPAPAAQGQVESRSVAQKRPAKTAAKKPNGNRTVQRLPQGTRQAQGWREWLEHTL